MSAGAEAQAQTVPVADAVVPSEATGQSTRLSLDDAYDRFATETQKLNSISSEPVDWEAVVNAGRRILEDQPRHFKAISYVALGLFETQRYSGLCEGCKELIRTLKEGWQAPSSGVVVLPGRENVGFLFDRLPAQIERTPPSVAERPSAIETAQVLDRFIAWLSDNKIKSIDSVPLTRDRLLKSTEDRPPSASKPKGKLPADKADEELGAEALRARGEALVLKASAKAVEEDARQAWPYRLRRALLWVDIDVHPSGGDGITQLSGPPKHLRDRFTDLAAKSDWRELLAASEEAFEEHRFWLDLQRFSHAALTGLSFELAARAVREETVSFASRLPDLAGMSFADRHPFADETTRAWLASHQPVLAEEPPVTADVQATSEEWLSELRRDLRSLKRGGRLQKAIQLLTDRLQRATTREKFLIRLELARQLTSANKADAALIVYQELDREIQAFSLERWEPELARMVLGEWFALTKASANGTADEERGAPPHLSQLFERLVLLDPSIVVAEPKEPSQRENTRKT